MNIPEKIKIKNLEDRITILEQKNNNNNKNTNNNNESLIELLTNNLVIFLFVFYLLIVGNHIGELLPCKLQKLFTENTIYKHILAYISLLGIIFVNNKPSETSEISKLFISSLFAYFIFFLSIKCDHYFWFLGLILIIILLAVRLTNNTNKNENKNNNTKKNKIEKILIISIVFVFVVGFLIYYVQKRLEFGKLGSYSWNWNKFLFSHEECSWKKSGHTQSVYDNKPIYIKLTWLKYLFK